ncbi:MAG TPA: hypothetical protein VH187_05485 [Scandinavium sp.]|nr:hypothetical protein [Scandinavium sp.]HEX4500613.1 hypothetical protein [Scandinavium sp.]
MQIQIPDVVAIPLTIEYLRGIEIEDTKTRQYIEMAIQRLLKVQREAR